MAEFLSFLSTAEFQADWHQFTAQLPSRVRQIKSGEMVPLRADALHFFDAQSGKRI